MLLRYVSDPAVIRPDSFSLQLIFKKNTTMHLIISGVTLHRDE